MEYAPPTLGERWTLTNSKGEEFEVYPGVDLSSTDLSSTDLSGADFHSADLIGANLHNVNFTGANLENAILVNAILIGAILRDAVLRGAILRSADLSGADVTGAELTDAEFEDADGFSLPEGWDFYPGTYKVRHDVAWVAERLADKKPDMEFLTLLYNEHPEMTLEELGAMTAIVKPEVAPSSLSLPLPSRAREAEHCCEIATIPLGE